MKYYNLGANIRGNIWNKSHEERNFVLLFFFLKFFILYQPSFRKPKCLSVRVKEICISELLYVFPKKNVEINILLWSFLDYFLYRNTTNAIQQTEYKMRNFCCYPS